MSVANAKVFAPLGAAPDEGALEQLANCLADERAVAGALMADHHLGYSMPICGWRHKRRRCSMPALVEVAS